MVWRRGSRPGRSQSGKMRAWRTEGPALSLQTHHGSGPLCLGLYLALAFLVDYSGRLPRKFGGPSGPGPRDEGAQDSGYSNDVSPSGTLASSVPRRPCGATEPPT